VALAAAPGFAQLAGEPSHHDHGPAIIRERHGRNVASDNWSGYAVDGAKGSVTDVKASWTVPAVTCPATGDQYASFWVGIDGYSSNTVEQIGTDSDCVNGVATYYAWYEFYPHPSFTIGGRTLAIHAGDVVSAEVSAGAGGSFTVTLTNITAGSAEKPFSVSAKIPSANRSSAEWIAEAPYSGGVLPLADFGNVSFNGPNGATLGTATGAIGSFPANTVDEITMVTKSGADKAVPSPLTNGSSFNITWVSPGP
jgi:hypothetical protein